MEHDNNQNEHLQGNNGQDAGTKFIKMKVRYKLKAQKW